MLTIGKRLERITEQLAAADCICGNLTKGGAVELVLVEAGWSEERIKQEELSKQIVCPVHGRQSAPTLRLAGGDIHG